MMFEQNEVLHQDTFKHIKTVSFNSVNYKNRAINEYSVQTLNPIANYGVNYVNVVITPVIGGKNNIFE